MIETIDLYVIDGSAAAIIYVDDTASACSAAVEGNFAVLDGDILSSDLNTARDIHTAYDGVCGELVPVV